jgi:hypothetical protein
VVAFTKLTAGPFSSPVQAANQVQVRRAQARMIEEKYFMGSQILNKSKKQN